MPGSGVATTPSLGRRPGSPWQSGRPNFESTPFPASSIPQQRQRIARRRKAQNRAGGQAADAPAMSQKKRGHERADAVPALVATPVGSAGNPESGRSRFFATQSPRQE